jgi:leucyl/phenylalanyl-tRNA---protein transferase
MPVFSLPSEPLFPPVSHAEEDGLLAVGGDLSPVRLLTAYASGIFPWYTEGREPILWWSPDPRMVLFTEELRISKSMRQVLKKGTFEITFDRAFDEVVRSCSKAPRRGQQGTWLGMHMQRAYSELHRLGYAHAAEAWQAGRLVGGLYGVAIGRVFCGESMFAHESNASKAAFITLVEALKQKGFGLIDCQVHTDHLESLGAREIPRVDFLALLTAGMAQPGRVGPWAEWLAE